MGSPPSRQQRSSHPFVRSAPSFRPDLRAVSAVARSGGQGWPVFGPPLQRRAASLTAASTTACSIASGLRSPTIKPSKALRKRPSKKEQTLNSSIRTPTTRSVGKFGAACLKKDRPGPRWVRDPDLNFPKRLLINGRRYWRRSELLAWASAAQMPSILIHAGEITMHPMDVEAMPVASLSPYLRNARTPER